jgi:hypothetical protein
MKGRFFPELIVVFLYVILSTRARGSIVVKALYYKPEDRGFDTPMRFFFNPILFANCTGTFSKLFNFTEACRRALSSTPPYLTSSRPVASVGNKTYELHLKD